MKRKKPITLVLPDEEQILSQKETTLELPEFTCQQFFEKSSEPVTKKDGLELIHKEGNITNHYHVQNLHWQLSIDGKVEKSEYDKFMYVLIATLWTFVVVLTTLLLTSHVDVL